MPTRIVEGQLPYSGGTGIGIDTNKVISILLREENNLIQVNGDNEIYTDLQLVANIKPSDDFPVGVTTGKILQSDGWTQSGLLLNWKTTSGDYARWIYANDGKIYFDNGTGTWKQVYYSSEVDNLIQTLRNYVDTFQPKLTAGTGIVIDQNNVISTTGGQGTGDVIGPNSSTDGNLAVFDGITGKVLKDGGPIPAPTTVVDALDSQSTTSALSANQGRILDGKIADMMGLGKFLSLWDSTTGQPISFPLATPYTYTTGDYFIIEVVSSATPPVNYRPNGSSYTGTASSVAETDEIEIGDVYVYDGQTWLLQSNHGKTVAFANIAGQPTDNTALANALNGKQNVLTAGTNIDITNNVISAEGLTILSYGNSTWNDFITAYNRGGLVYCRASSNSNPASGSQTRLAFMAYVNNETTPTEVEFQYYRSRSSHSTAANVLDEVYVYKLVSTNGGTWTVTQRDTAAKPLAGTGIGLTYNASGMTISADTSVLATKTDLNSKQDTLVSGTNIKTINGNSLLGSGNITIDESSFKVFTVTDLDDSAQCYEVYSRVRDGKPAAVIYGSRVFYYTGNYGRFGTTKYYFHTLYGYGETIFELILEANAQLYRWDEPTEVNLGGDVLVSDQPNNILTSGMKIWAGTEGDYANLSSYDNNTVYLTVEGGATQSSDQGQGNDSEGNR